jgi:hypothetical protein
MVIFDDPPPLNLNENKAVIKASNKNVIFRLRRLEGMLILPQSKLCYLKAKQIAHF